MIDRSLLRSREELRAMGKERRKAAPRSKHGEWKPAAARPDVLEMIAASNRGRVPELLPLRRERMLASPFAFFRGLPSAMAYDLSTTPVSDLRVQCSGDCHLENFGIYATPERNIVFDINDFDETLPGPWEWDLKRLATSAFIAGEMNGLDASECESVARRMAGSYRDQMALCSQMTAIEVWYSRIDAREVTGDLDLGSHASADFDPKQPAPLRQHVRVAEKFTTGDGAERRIREKPPELFHPPERNPVIADVEQLYDRYLVSLRDDVELLLRRYSVLDLAIKVVGVGSVGTRCAIALLMATDDDPLVLQIKEARPSILEPYLGASIYESHGQRIVAGQQLLQASSDLFLGWSAAEDGHEYYVRQLRDVKASIDTSKMSGEELERYAMLCGKTLASAHARSGEPASIAGYLGTGEVFVDAIATFARLYAKQVAQDYERFARS